MDALVATVLEWIIVGFLGVIGIIILWKILTDKIDLNSLLSEANGKASLSRFQLLLFTFVIVGIYVVLCLQAGELLEISNGVLGLLGISGSSYVLSKGIQMQASKPASTGGSGTASSQGNVASADASG
jgi:uncharacterized Tic20 family protein